MTGESAGRIVEEAGPGFAGTEGFFATLRMTTVRIAAPIFATRSYTKNENSSEGDRSRSLGPASGTEAGPGFAGMERFFATLRMTIVRIGAPVFATRSYTKLHEE